jgi:hypothetical protein
MSTDRIPASRGIASLTDIPEGECRHGPPELVIRCKHSVIPVPMLARRRDEIGEPVQELKRRELGPRTTPPGSTWPSTGGARAVGRGEPSGLTVAIIAAEVSDTLFGGRIAGTLGRGEACDGERGCAERTSADVRGALPTHRNPSWKKRCNTSPAGALEPSAG